MIEELRYTSLTELTGVGFELARKIQLTLGKDPHERGPGDEARALHKIHENPYELIQVRGIGFKKADAIAQFDFAVSEDSPLRHEHGNRAALASHGSAPPNIYRSERRKLGLLNPELEMEGVIRDSGRVWLPEVLEAEWTVARWLGRVREYQPAFADLALSDEQEAACEGLNDEQIQAVQYGLNGLAAMTLTGDAGSGKTTVIATLAKCAYLERKSMRVMAFSGKAADRAGEAMDAAGVDYVECMTIHRTLGYNGRAFTVPELEDDLIVIDEASMVPTELLAAVIRRVPEKATLILVGDPAQLPPIGHGFPFADILEYGVPGVHLVQNYRQAGQVSIFEFASAMRNKESYHFEPREGLRVHHSLTDDQLDTLSTEVVERCKEMSLHEWQVITWKNAVREALNEELQAMFNPNGVPILSYSAWGLRRGKGPPPMAELRVGDKVMVTQNAAEYGVFNGQTGVLDGTANVDGLQTLVLDMGARTALVPLIEAEGLLVLGFCSTVHKAQGSGWDTVIVFQEDAVGSFALPARFWYTAVTRASNELHLFTKMSAAQLWRNATERERLPESTLLRRLT